MDTHLLDEPNDSREEWRAAGRRGGGAFGHGPERSHALSLGKAFLLIDHSRHFGSRFRVRDIVIAAVVSFSPRKQAPQLVRVRPRGPAGLLSHRHQGRSEEAAASPLPGWRTPSTPRPAAP